MFEKRNYGRNSDPLQLYLSVVETCFDQEDCNVHFESTLEYSVFGNYRYTQRVFFEI